jgi:hypothetical protein
MDGAFGLSALNGKRSDRVRRARSMDGRHLVVMAVAMMMSIAEKACVVELCSHGSFV